MYAGGRGDFGQLGVKVCRSIIFFDRIQNGTETIFQGSPADDFG